MKESFILYKSHFDAICMLENSESQIKVLKCICNYMFYDTEPDTTGFSQMEKIIVTMAMPTLSNAKVNYEKGCKGGAPKGNQNAKKTTENKPENNPDSFLKTTQETTQETTQKTTQKTTQETTQKTSNVNVNVNLNDNYNDNVVCKWKNNNNTNIPSLQEVKKYCAEKNLKISAEYFFNYYDQKKWEGVKDWRLCALGWDKNQKKPVQNKHSYLKRKSCPECKANLLWWDNQKQKYICDSCGKELNYEEV